MSLRVDRVLSQTWRYAQHRHRRTASSDAERDRSARAFVAYAGQFDQPTRQRMSAVYYDALWVGPLFVDRRIRGRR
jgi:hypothetical protein